MGLSDDQRAMLRLLAQRGEEGYEDVAALMGLSVEEVRAKVAEALAELADEGALAPSRAASESTASPEPSAPEPEEPPAPASPAEPEPEQPKQEPAVVPEPVAAAEPEPRPAAPAPAPKPKRKSSDPPKISLPSGNGPRVAIAAALVVLVALVVVLVVSGGDSGSDSSSTSASSTTTSGESAEEAQAETTSNNAEATKAVLKPVDGGDASGVAVFGRVKNSLVLQIAVKGLAPTTKGTEYAICIAASPNRILPIASTAVGSDGTISASVKVPVGLLLYLANETYSEIVITLADSARLTAEIKRQSKEPTYTGTPVLRGEITGSIVGNKELLKEAREFEEAE